MWDLRFPGEVLLRITVFWDVTLCCQVGDSPCSKGLQCLQNISTTHPATQKCFKTDDFSLSFCNDGVKLKKQNLKWNLPATLLCTQTLSTKCHEHIVKWYKVTATAGQIHKQHIMYSFHEACTINNTQGNCNVWIHFVWICCLWHVSGLSATKIKSSVLNYYGYTYTKKGKL